MHRSTWEPEDLQADMEKAAMRASAARRGKAMTEIKKATQALIDMMEAEHVRLRNAMASYQDLKQLHSQCHDAANAIRRQSNYMQRLLRYHPDLPVYQMPPQPSEEQLKKQRREEKRAQKQEADLQQRVIDAGYRAMAAKLHPDAGGSHDAMLQLNEIRDRLKKQPVGWRTWRVK